MNSTFSLNTSNRFRASSRSRDTLWWQLRHRSHESHRLSFDANSSSSNEMAHADAEASTDEKTPSIMSTEYRESMD
ncbi:hypothetical protein OPV22_000470 [Ensete ventricosum]|uniref:Uncharacterized protein n=1 Tax=Ensete ventricosum TaxID=4639 RepID=A0AAV8Q9E6_ENSVE|nr:hypothetical protein OPV22_000470 [Ensete ventricosum]